MQAKTRRDILASSSALLAGAAVAGLSQSALSQDHMHHDNPGDGMRVSTSVEKTCATCQYWGGMRKTSENKQEVITQSMGWCNNPDSPNHGKLTQADHQMKKPGIWKKWSVL